MKTESHRKPRKVWRREGVTSFAKAIYELACEAESQEPFLKQLGDLWRAMEDSGEKELVSFVSNPAFSETEVQEVIGEIGKRLKLHKMVTAFVVQLALARRLQQLPAVIEIFRELHFAATKRQLVSVRTAVELSEAQRKLISRNLPAMLNQAGVADNGRELEIIEETDPNLLGGVVVQIGSRIFDGSLRGRLNQLKDRILST